MTAFGVVTIVVSLIAIALCFTAYFRIKNVANDMLARREEPPVAEQPSEDVTGERVSHRPLRGTPE
jgi:hypothetical protein